MTSFPNPRPSSLQSVERFTRAIEHAEDVTRAITTLDTFVEEIRQFGFSQVARAEGAAAFAERFGLIPHDAYLTYVEVFHEAAK